MPTAYHHVFFTVLLAVCLELGCLDYAVAEPIDLSGEWQVKSQSQGAGAYSEGTATFESLGEGRYKGTVVVMVIQYGGPVSRSYTATAVVTGDRVDIELVLSKGDVVDRKSVV